MKILGFAGSLRKGSYNRMLLNNAAALLPPDTTLETFDLAPIPPFNADFEHNMPPAVLDFKARIKAADAILIATPEYNHSVPGVLKNAMDWASRPYGDNSFAGKPVALMSAATGTLGGARAQIDLRHSFVFLDMHPVNSPEVCITFAGDKFDTGGQLTDDKARELIRQLLQALVNWTAQLKK